MKDEVEEVTEPYEGAEEMTLEQTAAYLGRSRRSVYRYAQTGSLPARKHGGRWYFDKNEVDGWLRGSGEFGEEPDVVLPSTWWEEMYAAKFRAFLRGVCDTSPDFVILKERVAERLADYVGGVPEDFTGKFIMMEAVSYLGDDVVRSSRFALIDDTVQRGTSLAQAAVDLCRQGATEVQCFAFVRCIDVRLDVPEDAPPIVAFQTLSGPEFKRYFAGQTEFLESRGLPLDIDHAIVKLSLDVQGRSDWLIDFWRFLEPLGNVFSVPSPAERSGIVEVTLDSPNFFHGVSLMRPKWVTLDGVHKIRFYIHMPSAIVYAVPIVTTSLDGSAFLTSECPFDSPMRALCADSRRGGAGSHDAAMLHCQQCSSLELGSHLIEKFVRLLITAEEKIGIALVSAEVDSRNLGRMYGDVGRSLGDSLQEALSAALSGRPLQASIRFPAEPPRMQDRATRRRELGGWFSALPLARLLVQRRREARASGADVLTAGLTITQIREALGAMMRWPDISRALDFLLDLSVIVPVDVVTPDGVTRVYRAGEGSDGTGVLDPSLGSGDGLGEDTVVHRFSQDMSRIAFVLATASDAFGFRYGVAENIAHKLLAIVRLDCVPEGASYLERSRDRFGTVVQTFATPGGLRDRPTPLVGLAKFGTFTVNEPDTKRSYRTLQPAKGWETRFDGVLSTETDEVAAIEATVRVLGELFRRHGRDYDNASDPLIIIAGLRNEGMAYAHAYEDLKLWITDFYMIKNELLNDDPSERLRVALTDARYSSEQVEWKCASFERLDVVRNQLLELYRKPGTLQSTARRLAGRLEVQDSSQRVRMLGRFGKLLSRLTALAANVAGDGFSEKTAQLVARANEGMSALGLPLIDPTARTRRDIAVALDRAYEAVVAHSRSNFANPSDELLDEMDELDLMEREAAYHRALRRRQIADPLVVFVDGRSSTAVGLLADDEVGIAAGEHALAAAIAPNLKTHGGEIEEMHGDDMIITFDGAEQALICGFEILERGQQLHASGAIPWPLRIGMHRGDLVKTRRNLSGTPINVASKLCSAARDWQVLVTDKVKLTAVNTPCTFNEVPVDLGGGLSMTCYVAERDGSVDHAN